MNKTHIKELNDIYDFIDSDQFDDIEAIKKLANLRDKTIKKTIIEKINNEIDLLRLNINDGLIITRYYATDEGGKPIQQEALETFTDKNLKYLKCRTIEAKNPIIRSFYYNVLWCKTKHQDDAKMTVECYLSSIVELMAMDKINPGGFWGLKVIKAIENAFHVAKKAKINDYDVKKMIVNLIKNYPESSSSIYALRLNLIELMLQHGKIFSKSDYSGFLGLLWGFAKKNESYCLDRTIEIINIGEQICRKFNRKSNRWSKRIAFLYEKKMKNAEKERSFISLTYCRSAIDNYKKINGMKKVEQLTKKYQELKKNIELEQLNEEVDITEYMKQVEKRAEKITELSSREIINYIISSSDLMPNYQELQKRSKILYSKSIFHQLGSETILDVNFNESIHAISDEDKIYIILMRNYGIDTKLKLYMLGVLIEKAFLKGKVDVEQIIDFWKEHSWYSQDLKICQPNNKAIFYRWDSLLLPGFFDLFERFMYVYAERKNIDFTLFIDSIVQKIEGIIRDICKISVTTTKITRCGTTQEKNLKDLLQDEKVKNIIGEDDYYFLKYLLIEQSGFYLRHKVAHSFTYRSDYNIGVALLLFLVIMRLGRYKIKLKRREDK